MPGLICDEDRRGLAGGPEGAGSFASSRVSSETGIDLGKGTDLKCLLDQFPNLSGCPTNQGYEC